MARNDLVASGAGAALDSPHPGPTLLPGPVAQVVSLATRSTSLAIRLSSFVSSFGLDAARFTTLSSLELARGMVEVILSRAARDSLAQSGSDLAAADAETILERSLENLHYAVSQVVFWTSASFRLTGTTLTAASEASQLLLSSFDQLFGSTDSSRAVASIITLIRREFNNPATGARGEKVGVIDLVLALGALAYLQRVCRRTPAEERRRRLHEETIWDVVVLGDGQRVDVVQKEQSGATPDAAGLATRAYDDDEVILARLKSQIISSMPPGTSVDISDTVSSVQTITVDVQGSQLPSLPTPPGAEIIETRGPSSAGSSGRSRSSLELTKDGKEASYRVVYRIEREKMRSTSVRRQDEASGPVVIELPDTKPPQTPGLQDSPVITCQSPDPCPSPADSCSDSSSSSTEFTQSFPRPTPASELNTDAPSAYRSRARIVVPSPAEVAANQKKQRSPLAEPSSRDNVGRPRPRLDTGKRSLSKKKLDSGPPSNATDKKAGFKQALKGKGQSISSMWSREQSSPESSRPSPRSKPQWKSPGGGNPADQAAGNPKLPAPRNSNQPAHRSPPARRSIQAPELEPRAGSRSSYFSIHEHRRDSVVSQADAYSKTAYGDMRPASPTMVRTDFATQESVTRPRSDLYTAQIGAVPPSPHRSHRLSASYAPSLYSLATNDSQSSLVLSSYYQKSTYNGSDALRTLRREGFVDGTFPTGPLLPNIARYMRFSSACYGSHFLKFMGISTELPSRGVWDGMHHDVRHFVHHTESEAGNILLASFVDPQGGADATGSTGTGVPLVHYISLDHAAKAVVLACRGTLGFEDVMADMACEYDDLTWRGRRYRVHKGMHASARRLLYGGDGRVLVTIKEALREFPNYGLVLCGHSLGAGVTALLGVMLAQPNPEGPGFVTSAEPHARLLTQSSHTHEGIGDMRLPPGRRIHVYAYGPPGVMSASLGKITRGLVTSVVHGNDLVPHLSLGLLHDFQALALAFKHDENKTKAEIRQRMWHVVQSSVAERWRRAEPRPPAEADEEQWTLPALAALRDSMKGAKLVPPGEVFAIETQRVLRRDAFVVVDDEGPVGRPAQRVVLKYIRDVEARFGEVRFGTGLLMDHSPAKYEDALNMLRLGVVD